MGSRALIVVDVQVDFCEGGSLAVSGGNGVARAITGFIDQAGDRYAVVVATRDHHVDPGAHFASPGTEPDYVDTWPTHCVVGTPGADYHPGLQLPPTTVHLRKGATEAAYSGFEGVTNDGRGLRQVLEDGGISAVDVVGIAESHCVAATALDARQAGLETRILSDLTVGVSEATTSAARARMDRAGVTRSTSAGALVGLT